MDSDPLPKSALLKLSGEALSGGRGFGIDEATLTYVASEIRSVVQAGWRIAIVVGGGNFFRGAAGALSDVPRVRGDAVGMLATLMNSLVLESALHGAGVPARAFSSFVVGQIMQPYSPAAARTAITEGQVAILGGGTGNPYFTTDTAAVLRALECGLGAVVKATKVDGIYDRDPAKYPDARFIAEITYDEVIERELGVMDLTAITMARDGRLPLVVVNMNKPGAILRALEGQGEGSRVIP